MAPRLVPGILSAALVLAVASPVLRAPADDGYPLSTYPMFAFRRPTSLTLDYALGITATGERVTLRPWHAGSTEVLQARATIEKGVRGGAQAQKALCGDIARRVASDPSFAEVVSIRLVTGTHDAVEYLVRHVEGVEKVRASCPVDRGERAK
ncbi:MAG TPA: hypothetical protein VLB44_09265 [Kofleriaceae bacterium]|nr:hypothetical protein [Kofleriaceae bacterium]